MRLFGVSSGRRLAARVPLLRAIHLLEDRPLMSTGELGSRRPDRRRAPRYPFQAHLEIEWGSARLKARTRDISVSGMFIESEDVLWVGAGFRARLIADRPVLLECSVKRVEPGLGMGVTIAHPEEQSGAQYQELLAKLAQAI